MRPEQLIENIEDMMISFGNAHRDTHCVYWFEFFFFFFFFKEF